LHAPEYAPFGFNSLSLSNGSAPRSPCIVRHNEPLVPAPLLSSCWSACYHFLTWYEYVGVESVKSSCSWV
jgi:hypothetical protein